MKRWTSPSGLCAMALLATAAILPVLPAAASKPQPAARQSLNWNNAVAVTPGGSHVVGNPAAGMKLVEYVSYTCPHCAAFDREADMAMRMAWVANGRLSIEVRHYLRDPVDLTVALLTNCGTPNRFFLNHSAFLRSQAEWIQPMMQASDAQRLRWTSGDMAGRRRAIASDFHLYEIMERRGYGRNVVDRCLADEAMAQRLSRMNLEADRLGISGTPSFLLNGVLLAGTHDWKLLEPQLSARF